MSSGNRASDEGELTPDERAQLDAFGAGHAPGVELKRRTTEALRARGLVGPLTGPRRGGQFGPPVWLRRRTTRLLAAAASVVVLAGVVEYMRVRHETGRPERLAADSGAAAHANPAPKTPIVERHVVWF
jgi:hypothetical protein